MAAMPQSSLTIKRIVHFGDDRDKNIQTKLSKGDLEEAEFFCKDRDLYVTFNYDEGSPFEKDCFHVHRGEVVPSGPLKKGVPIGGIYRYRVETMGTVAGTDPEIIITN